MILDFIVKQLQETAWLMLGVGLLVFAEMFVAKKWFTPFTKKIENAKARRSLNLFLGSATCFLLTVIEMFAICDLVKGSFSWLVAGATAAAVTLVYLMIEKIFSESDLNELGRAICSLVSKSTKFDGKLSKKSIVTMAKQFLEKEHSIDYRAANEAAKRESAVVNDVIDRLTAIISDDKVTDEERKEVEAMVAADPSLEGTSYYAKYKDILGR